jgi:hypothetical protein
MIRLSAGRWYVAAVVRLPSVAPACLGFGLPASEAAARAAIARMVSA